MNRSKKSVPTSDNHSPSRRKFLQGGGMMLAGGALVGSNLSVARSAHAYGSDSIKIGLIGCGHRGTEAAIEALKTAHRAPLAHQSQAGSDPCRSSGRSGLAGEVQLVAMADVFANNLHTAYRSIKGRCPQQVDTVDRHFVGLDAYQNVLQCDLDLVILATPPGFRPQQFEAAVNAGKHVFMEKPLATDPSGVRRILAANQVAQQKGLAVQVGLQRRHERRYAECIGRLQGGAIGELQLARAYWNGGPSRVRPRTRRQSELEYQLRNWYHFTWLGGDHVVEQHIHNLDVINWLVQSHPIEAQGQGGRELGFGADHGQIYDHHMIEYTYANGFKLFSQCRQIQGCWRNVSEHVHGTCGTADISNALIRDLDGQKTWQSESVEVSGRGWQQEFDDLFTAIRRGEIPNECESAALSTMTAILGRLATYSGKMVTWDQAFWSDVKLADTDRLHVLSDTAPVLPDSSGNYPIARPANSSRVV